MGDRDRHVKSLPPLLQAGLKVVFVGTEPGAESLRMGNYYANSSNGFYATLHQSGFTPRQLAPSEYQRLLGFQIGLDDVYGDPRALRKRLEDASPIAVCFNSRAALEAFAGSIDKNWRGPAAARYAAFAGTRAVWAVPDSSGLAGGFRHERIELLVQLRARFNWSTPAEEPAE